MARRKRIAGIVTGLVATALVATGIIVAVVGPSTEPRSRYNTSLDASTSTTLPGDWSRGYSRTGTVCYAQSATASTCFAANTPPTARDATDLGWVVDVGRVNRIPRNISSACGGLPWTCSATASMDSTTIAPDGNATASQVTLGGGDYVELTATGYTAATALDLRLWAKCPSTGTLTLAHQGGTGSWTVDATALSSAWSLLHETHAAVTESAQMTSDATGEFKLRVSGLGCALWMPTATEVVDTRWHSTIPTSGVTSATVGAATWSVDNSSGAYWAASGVTKVETISTYSGAPCWSYSGSTIKLSGASQCTGIWYALSLTWTY